MPAILHEMHRSRETLGDMAIPASVFNLRPTQAASTDKPTVEKRSYIGRPVVVVVVVEVREHGSVCIEARYDVPSYVLSGPLTTTSDVRSYVVTYRSVRHDALSAKTNESCTTP